MRKARIAAIEYHLPSFVLSNEQLARENPQWTSEDIETKTGIRERRIAAADECSSDLAVAAANKLFERDGISPADIDFLLLCTQSPDYFLPTTACLVQHRLGLATTTGALDFNLGCSGFVYGIGLAKGLIETEQARRVLLITAETYSKFVDAADRGTRTIFGDAAAATLIEGVESGAEMLSAPVYGTDGAGAKNLMVQQGAMRRAGKPSLTMVGPSIFNFTIRSIPPLIEKTLERAGRSLSEIDLFVFHQANRYMLEHLRRKLAIPEERFFIFLEDCGNTVSSTIPIALLEAERCGKLRRGHTVMIVGFGVGYSWAASLIQW